MNDRELLEYAAKAAGMKISFYPDEICRDVTGFHPAQNIFAAKGWNPLTDDGDALRLAVKLEIVPRSINGVVFAWKDGVCDMQEPHNGDPYAATRRAIVRAAAEIGKAM